MSASADVDTPTEERPLPDAEKDVEKPDAPESEPSTNNPDQPEAPVTRITTAKDWAGPDDKDNPQLWSPAMKLYHASIPTILAFVVSLDTSIYEPSIESLSAAYGVSTEVGLLGFMTYVLGLGFGPVIGSPMSETLGRRAVYLISMPVFALFTMGAGFAQNIETVIICRFFAGFFGGPILAVGAGTMADMYPVERRALTNTCYCLAAFLATGVGPIIGAYGTSRKSFRWVEWITIFFFLASYVYSLPQRETYKKTILAARARKLHLPGPPIITNPKFFLTVTLLRPIHMLFTEPIVLSFAIYVAFNFAVLFGFLPAIPLIFSEVYHFTPEQTGWPFLGIFVGSFLALPTQWLLDVYIYQHKRREALALAETDPSAPKHVAPEHRLYGALLGSFGLPIGLFWFAWTSRHSIHWIVPILALIPFAWGNVCVFVSALLYMTDTYQALNGASAIAANGVLRYLAGATFPLFTAQMYNKLGIGWGASLLGFVTVGLLPVPWILFRWGRGIRGRSGYDTLKA